MDETTDENKMADILSGMIMANAMTVNLLCSKNLVTRDDAVACFKTMSDALLKNNFSASSTFAIDLIANWIPLLHLPPHEFAQKMRDLLKGFHPGKE